MYRKLIAAVFAAVLALPLTACVLEFENAGSMLTGAVKEYRETVDMSNEYMAGDTVKLEFDMKLAKAEFAGTGEKLADVEFIYSSEALKPEFTVKNDTISIVNNLKGHNFRNAVNIWHVKLAESLPLEMELSADGSDLKFDMSRMKISNIDADLSASTAKFLMDEPGKAQPEKIRLDADASSVNIYGAGNMSFKELDIDADASKITLDFTGEYKGDGKVRINANASTVKIRLPHDVGVRIVTDKTDFSSVNIENDRILNRSDREYVSKGYESAGKTLIIYADLNITTLTIE